MKPIWAPWRMAFIESDKEQGCVFCDLAKAEINDESLVLWRGERVYVVMNRYPYANGHLLVIPYAHVASPTECDRETLADVMTVTSKAIPILTTALKCEGINAGMNLGRVAGAGILHHFHFHIVPRWNGDANFLPVIGDTRCMPEYLAATYARLKPHFDSMA